jgi:hypothetical protein
VTWLPRREKEREKKGWSKRRRRMFSPFCKDEMKRTQKGWRDLNGIQIGFKGGRM